MRDPGYSGADSPARGRARRPDPGGSRRRPGRGSAHRTDRCGPGRRRLRGRSARTGCDRSRRSRCRPERSRRALAGGSLATARLAAQRGGARPRRVALHGRRVVAAPRMGDVAPGVLRRTGVGPGLAACVTHGALPRCTPGAAASPHGSGRRCHQTCPAGQSPTPSPHWGAAWQAHVRHPTSSGTNPKSQTRSQGARSGQAGSPQLPLQLNRSSKRASASGWSAQISTR